MIKKCYNYSLKRFLLTALSILLCICSVSVILCSCDHSRDGTYQLVLAIDSSGEDITKEYIEEFGPAELHIKGNILEMQIYDLEPETDFIDWEAMTYRGNESMPASWGFSFSYVDGYITLYQINGMSSMQYKKVV